MHQFQEILLRNSAFLLEMENFIFFFIIITNIKEENIINNFRQLGRHCHKGIIKTAHKNRHKMELPCKNQCKLLIQNLIQYFEMHSRTMQSNNKHLPSIGIFDFGKLEELLRD